MTQREVRFLITDHRDEGRYTIEVRPTLSNIYCAQGGEEILLSIAANCIRMIAKTSGLEGAMERFHRIAVTKTKIDNDKWPWE